MGSVLFGAVGTGGINGLGGGLFGLVGEGESGKQTYFQAVLADSPLGYWRLGETPQAGTWTVADSSGNGRNASVSGQIFASQTGLLVADSNAAMSYSRNLNESINITIGATAPIVGSQSFTLEALIKPNSTALAAAETAICGFGTNVAHKTAILELASGTPGLDTNGSGVNSPTALTAGNIYHLVARYDATGPTADIWVNAVQKATGSVTAMNLPTSYSFQIFNAPAGVSTLNFLATADEVAWYAGVLSSARILAHYNASLGN